MTAKAVATSPPCPQVPTHPRDYIHCFIFFRFLWSGISCPCRSHFLLLQVDVA